MLGNPLSRKEFIPKIIKLEGSTQYLVSFQGQQNFFVSQEDAERYARKLYPNLKRIEAQEISKPQWKSYIN